MSCTCGATPHLQSSNGIAVAGAACKAPALNYCISHVERQLRGLEGRLERGLEATKRAA